MAAHPDQDFSWLHMDEAVMTYRVNPQVIEQEIANLLLLYPELADDEQLRADMIEGETDLHEYLRTLIRQNGEDEAHCDAIASYQDDLQSRRLRKGRRIDARRELILRLMQKADQRKIDLPEATLSVKNGPRKLVGEVNPNILPDVLCRIKREANRHLIKQWLEEGQTLEGFHLSNGEPQLSIRTK